MLASIIIIRVNILVYFGLSLGKRIRLFYGAPSWLVRSVGNNRKEQKVLNTSTRMLLYMIETKKSPADSSQDLFLALRFKFFKEFEVI